MHYAFCALNLLACFASVKTSSSLKTASKVPEVDFLVCTGMCGPCIKELLYFLRTRTQRKIYLDSFPFSYATLALLIPIFLVRMWVKGVQFKPYHWVVAVQIPTSCSNKYGNVPRRMVFAGAVGIPATRSIIFFGTICSGPMWHSINLILLALIAWNDVKEIHLLHRLSSVSLCELSFTTLIIGHALVTSPSDWSSCE